MESNLIQHDELAVLWVELIVWRLRFLKPTKKLFQKLEDVIATTSSSITTTTVRCSWSPVVLGLLDWLTARSTQFLFPLVDNCSSLAYIWVGKYWTGMYYSHCRSTPSARDIEGVQGLSRFQRSRRGRSCTSVSRCDPLHLYWTTRDCNAASASFFT